MKNPSSFKNILRLPAKSGFALVVTLVLMVLLSILALGMLGLSSITLRTSSVSSPQQQARANARMAMMIALAALQESTGPDQRVTASANLAGNATGSEITGPTPPVNNTNVDGTSKGLTTVYPGTRHWTGVWKPRASNPSLEIFTKTSAPTLVKWLVSGNETATASPGSIDYEINASGEVKLDSGGEPLATILVGANSVGTGSYANYVAAPLVKIKKSVNGDTTGKYAWWIGDEGTKSRINLGPALSPNVAVTYPGLSASRRAWETVNGYANYPQPGTSQSNLLKVVTTKEMELL
ncbi:MAG: hypothetical protein H7Y36_07050, partial [Armatimonadetes bacterium]|nr:hypothetical protein [Akkermansiaceae bacterium]